MEYFKTLGVYLALLLVSTFYFVDKLYTFQFHTTRGFIYAIDNSIYFSLTTLFGNSHARYLYLPR